MRFVRCEDKSETLCISLLKWPLRKLSGTIDRWDYKENRDIFETGTNNIWKAKWDAWNWNGLMWDDLSTLGLLSEWMPHECKWDEIYDICC